jgi:hypothetical protein
VTVARADGSVIIGYVDKSSGIVYDWVVKKSPDVTPTPAASAQAPSGGESESAEPESQPSESQSSEAPGDEDQNAADEDD